MHHHQRQAPGTARLRLPIRVAKHAAPVRRIHFNFFRLGGDFQGRPGKKVAHNSLQMPVRKAAPGLKRRKPPGMAQVSLANRCIFSGLLGHAHSS